ncbi:MAG: tRNA threonylcarbamoyladenosine dehydratase [Clostridiales bacterium]|nr:tRNA threonylcarbamoyladenosine dehydratase [Clostridiales bacterium]
MPDQFSRTRMLLGPENMKILLAAKVAVFGIGGVGGHCAEALIRSGIGAMDIFDNDRVSLTNINRQLIATHSTLGRYKVEVMKERLLDINPEAKIGACRFFYLPETAEQIDILAYDYLVDAVDTISAKLDLVCRAQAAGKPLISSMGAGNKLEASALVVADIYETKNCPLARVMRRELRKRNITALKVVYSPELPHPPHEDAEADESEASIKNPNSKPKTQNSKPKQQGCPPSSSAFVPPVAGLIMAGEVIKDLLSL